MPPGPPIQPRTNATVFPSFTDVVLTVVALVLLSPMLVTWMLAGAGLDLTLRVLRRLGV